MTYKAKKAQVWWAIKSGRLLLPFTARITRAQCVREFVHGRGKVDRFTKPVKVFVTEVRQ